LLSPPLLLPSTSHRTNIPEAEMPLLDSRSRRVQQSVLRDSQGLLRMSTLRMRLLRP
ncbi:hypothetical protein Tco_0330156, partial [Tanacetum coccineum]